MTLEHFNNLIRVLEDVGARPAMFAGRTNPEWISKCLDGFETAALFALEMDPEAFRMERVRVLESHGWDQYNPRPYGMMYESGMSPEEAITELVAMEIEFLRLVVPVSH